MRADWHFRPLLEVDLERQWRWLNEPHVNRWWSQRRLTRAEVRAKYLPRLRGEHKTMFLVALFKGLPAGYVQTYRIADHAEYAPGFVLPGGGWALDWFIGEPSLLGHGHGARLIDGFVSSWLWARSDPTYAVAGSSLDNMAALKSYERADFVQWFSTLPRTTSERYYRRDRTKGEGWNAKNK